MDDRDRWRRVKAVFQASLACPAGAREAFLAAACRDDIDLERDVLSLLHSHREAGGFLSQPATARPDRSRVVRRRIGPYRLLGKAGEGGMGVVYRAVRDDDASETVVAVKLVHVGSFPQHACRLRDTRVAEAPGGFLDRVLGPFSVRGSIL